MSSLIGKADNGFISFRRKSDGNVIVTLIPSVCVCVCVRYRLTRIAVDNAAGPHRNHTVVFLGSERGIVLKFLAKMRSGFLNDSLFLEELSVYNPQKCVFH